MTLQEALDRCGLADRAVLSTISADFVHMWNNDEVGFALRVDRQGNAQLEVNSKNGDDYFTYCCDLSQIEQRDVECAIEALGRGLYRELRGDSIVIGCLDNVLILNAAG